ncbi:MAG: dihydrofolate reductase [Patescibacteria group bacterium]
MINMIVAIGANREIGGGNDLLWKIPADLQRFKRITMGHPMVMGRKTYESIGRPLPGRTSIVITRNKGFKAPDEVIVVESLEQALEEALKLDSEVFVIGGGQIYAEALPITDKLYLTKVHQSFPEADIFFPEIVGFSEFVPTESGEEEGLAWEYGIVERLP